MSNSNVNKIGGINYYENKQNNGATVQKYEDSTQNSETEKKISKSDIKMNVSCVKDLEIKVEQDRGTSIIKTETVLDMGDKLFQNLNCVKPKQVWSLRKPKHNQNFFSKELKIKMWTLTSVTEKKKDVGPINGVDLFARNDFVKLVMSIMLMMCLATAIWLMIIFQIKSLSDLFSSPSLLLTVTIATGMMAVYTIMVCVKPARRPPFNYVLATLSVLFTSMMASIVTSHFRTRILIFTFITLSFIVLVCIGLSFTTFDFTSFWLYFVVLSSGISAIITTMIIGILLADVHIKMIHILLLLITVCIQGMGLTMELQMILGNKSIELDEKDFVMAAFLLYTSVMKIFLNLAQILGMLDSD